MFNFIADFAGAFVEDKAKEYKIIPKGTYTSPSAGSVCYEVAKSVFKCIKSKPIAEQKHFINQCSSVGLNMDYTVNYIEKFELPKDNGFLMTLSKEVLIPVMKEINTKTPTKIFKTMEEGEILNQLMKMRDFPTPQQMIGDFQQSRTF